MGIHRKTPMDQIRAHIEKKLEERERQIVRRLGVLGEMCLNHAKRSNEYKDQTGNLRSSLGYIILKDGLILTKGGFEEVKEGKSGTKTGFSYANELLSNYRTGYVLIVVAGMNYASYVEATGRDVLSSAEQLAIREAPRILKQLL